MPPLKVSVIIPVYNEAATIVELLRRVDAVPIEKEIIIIDDGSTDGTAGAIDAFLEAEWRGRTGVRLIRQRRNQGKGAAVRAGFEAATGDAVIIQDADLEYNPAEYPLLLAPIMDGRADVVFGSRFVGGEAHRVLYFWHYVANRMLTVLSNALTNLNLTDMEVCYKAFRSEIIKRIIIEEDRFGFEPEITAKVARLKCRVYEVGISYSGRTYEEGKKITWRDGVRALWCIVKYNLMQ